MNRIEKKFKDLKKARKKAFIAFITAGYPNLSTTEKLIYELSKVGVDILELGVPFSDPLADGPVIQESSQEALKKNTHLIDILDLVKKARKNVDIPICLMTYYNPIFCFDELKFVKSAIDSGVDGVIIPDLPPDEGKSFVKLAKSHNLDVICFISPTTSRDRMKYISGISKGFIYYVSLTGVTGSRQDLPKDLINNLKIIKKITDKPVCVGFGVSTSFQVKQIEKIADGAIVGSAIVKKIKDNIGKADLVKTVGKFVSQLKHV
jgi:tryptophan synthase alpha chain